MNGSPRVPGKARAVKWAVAQEAEVDPEPIGWPRLSPSNSYARSASP
jgi:hypothetical protein